MKAILLLCLSLCLLAPTAPIAQVPTNQVQLSAPTSKNNRNVTQEARGICELLKADGVASCKVTFHLFFPNSIDAVMSIKRPEARKLCEKIASMTHEPGSPFVDREWELKFFDPWRMKTPPSEWWQRIFTAILESEPRPLVKCRL